MNGWGRRERSPCVWRFHVATTPNGNSAGPSPSPTSPQQEKLPRTILLLHFSRTRIQGIGGLSRGPVRPSLPG
jgi:hypothetical protein